MDREGRVVEDRLTAPDRLLRSVAGTCSVGLVGSQAAKRSKLALVKPGFSGSLMPMKNAGATVSCEIVGAAVRAIGGQQGEKALPRLNEQDCAV